MRESIASAVSLGGLIWRVKILYIDISFSILSLRTPGKKGKVRVGSGNNRPRNHGSPLNRRSPIVETAILVCDPSKKCLNPTRKRRNSCRKHAMWALAGDERRYRDVGTINSTWNVKLYNSDSRLDSRGKSALPPLMITSFVIRHVHSRNRKSESTRFVSREKMRN